MCQGCDVNWNMLADQAMAVSQHKVTVFAGNSTGQGKAEELWPVYDDRFT